MCDNVSAWERDLEGESDGPPSFEPVLASDPVLRRVKVIKGVSLFRFQKVRSEDYCAVQPSPGPTGKIESLVVKIYRGLPPNERYLSNGYVVPLLAAAFPPNTPLRNVSPISR